MPFNGSGTYNLPAGNPVVSGTTISSTVQNNTMNDLATALTDCMTRDGQSPATTNIPLGGFKLTGLGNGTVATDAANLGQSQGQAFAWCSTAGGTANGLTLSPNPSISAYVAGQTFRFKAGASPNNAATTVAISGLSTIAIQVNGSACVGGEIAANQWYELMVDGSATSAQLSAYGRSEITLSIVASGATPDIFANFISQTISYTGTATCTGFVAAPSPGAQRKLLCTGACLFTAGANLLIEGIPSGTTITLAANAIVNVTAITTTQFKITYSLSGSFTASISSTYLTVQQTSTAIYSINNGVATVYIPALLGTSNSTLTKVSGFPSCLWAANSKNIVWGSGYDNGNQGMVTGGVPVAIDVSINFSQLFSAWTNVNTKGIQNVSITYSLA